MPLIIMPKQHYTIPSDNRELQHGAETEFTFSNYTIPSDNRELQQIMIQFLIIANYTIPSDNRELQHQYMGLVG